MKTKAKKGYNSLSTEAQADDIFVMRDMVLMNIDFFTEKELEQCCQEKIISREDLIDALSPSVA